MAIRNIIFDYGQVIINLDFNRTQQEFEKAGVMNFSALFTQLQQLPFFDAYDRGLISNEAFRDAIRENAGNHFTNDVIDRCWNAMLLDIPKARLEFLERMKSTYNTFLLSNTNFIHLDAISIYLQSAYGIKNIDPYFIKAYYSCAVGMRKPQPEIFELVLKENNLQPEETLFIDDGAQHIKAAAALGIQTILLKEGQEVEKVVWEYLSH